MEIHYRGERYKTIITIQEPSELAAAPLAVHSFGPIAGEAWIEFKARVVVRA